MAIAGDHNVWWWDTLENGASSRYAPYFDIEWNAPEERLRNKILLPVLEDHSGLMIEARKLALERQGGGFLFRYYDHAFPVAPESMAGFLSKCAQCGGNSELAFLADSLSQLQMPAEFDWAGLKARHRFDIGRLSPAFPVTPPDMRVRIRRFGGLSYRQPVNLGIPSESK
jgi:(1->4)-alpha-D-glucan 1-alpha-D-glucosylmutase